MQILLLKTPIGSIIICFNLYYNLISFTLLKKNDIRKFLILWQNIIEWKCPLLAFLGEDVLISKFEEMFMYSAWQEMETVLQLWQISFKLDLRHFHLKQLIYIFAYYIHIILSYIFVFVRSYHINYEFVLCYANRYYFWQKQLINCKNKRFQVT